MVWWFLCGGNGGQIINCEKYQAIFLIRMLGLSYKIDDCGGYTD